MSGVSPSGRGGYIKADRSERSAFGVPVSAAQSTQIAEVTTTYQDSRRWETFTGGTGSISVENGEVVLATGTTANSYYTLQTLHQLMYVPGVGQQYAGSVAFPDNGVASCLLFWGAYTGESGYMLGYDGVDFGVFHRYGRKFEIQKLTLTAAATGAETATITLGGTGHSVAITAGTIAKNAAEIEDYGNATGFADSGSTYTADAVTRVNGDVEVIFARQLQTDPPGAYTYSSTGDSAGTFAQLQDATSGTQTHAPLGTDTGGIVYVDPLDGTGPSGITLDPTYGNVYRITAGWLGYSGVEWWLKHPTEPEFVRFAVLNWANTSRATRPLVDDPRMPVGYVAASLGSTTNLRVRGGSVSASMHGSVPLLNSEAARGATSTTGVTSTEAPVFSIKCANEFDGRFNRRPLRVKAIELLSTGTKEVTARVYLNATLTGAQWTEIDSESVAHKDTAATAFAATSAPLITERLTAANGDRASRIIDLVSIRAEILVDRRETITVTGKTDSSTGGLDVVVIFEELP